MDNTYNVGEVVATVAETPATSSHDTDSTNASNTRLCPMVTSPVNCRSMTVEKSNVVLPPCCNPAIIASAVTTCYRVC